MDCGALQPLQPVAIVCMAFDHHPALHVVLPLPDPPLSSSEWLSSPTVGEGKEAACNLSSQQGSPACGAGAGPWLGALRGRVLLPAGAILP